MHGTGVVDGSNASNNTVGLIPKSQSEVFYFINSRYSKARPLFFKLYKIALKKIQAK